MRGVYTALVTPFDSGNEIDFTAYRRILQDQRAAGISGVIPSGTTGESPTLTVDEKKKLFEVTLQELKGTGVKVIAGTGSNNTRETVELSRWASDAGADAVLVVTPYYNKPTPAGMEAHYRAVADAVKCEVMLYNVPGRTGISLTTGTISALASHPQITSLKEATANTAFTSEIIDVLQLAGKKMDILSGDDAAYLPLLAAGAVGVVSVASNLFPRSMVAIQKAMDANEPKKAFEIHQRFYPLFRDLFIESNPGPIKHAMAFAGWCAPGMRPPLAPLTTESARRLEASLARCGVEKGRLL